MLELKHDAFTRTFLQEDGMLQPEGIQGVTGGIGSLDLREDSRSPRADMNLDQVCMNSHGIHEAKSLF
jgi:hypothetical protein